MNKYTKPSVDRKHLEYGFWLIFDREGSVRLLRGQPSINCGERAMSMNAKLPLSLFATPQLSATLTVDAPAVEPMVVDLRAASEALSMAIRIDCETCYGEGWYWNALLKEERLCIDCQGIGSHEIKGATQ